MELGQGGDHVHLGAAAADQANVGGTEPGQDQGERGRQHREERGDQVMALTS